MTITPTMRNLVEEALVRKGMKRVELAERIGARPSWVTRFFNGTLEGLTQEKRQKIEEVLGVQFVKMVEGAAELPSWVIEAAEMAEEYPEIQVAVTAAIRAIKRARGEDMEKEGLGELGRRAKAIAKAGARNEKVGRELLALLADLSQDEGLARVAENPARYAVSSRPTLSAEEKEVIRSAARKAGRSPAGE
jgi:transcriptional regulator with XRE-family HTH domain